MKTHIKYLMGGVASAALLMSTAQAGEKMVVTEPMEPAPVCSVPFTGSVSVGYETVYLFRGVDFGHDAPWASLDLSYALSDAVSIDFGGWYINPTQDPVDFDELDVYAFVNFPVGPLSASVGLVWFYFAEIDDEALEFDLSLGYSVGDLFDIGTLIVYDETTEGWYFEANIGKSIPLTDCLELGLAAGISYGDDYYGVSDWNHTYVTAGLSYALTETASLDLYIGGNFTMDGLEDLGEDDDVHGGVSVTVSF